MKKLALAISFMLTAMGLNAITVTRYVSPDGTGNGMTPETPTSDIAAMLAIGSKVDGLNLKVAPGVYSIKSTSSDWSSIKNVVFDGTWNNEGTEDKVRISTKDISFANCNIKNVSFSGDLVLHGGNLIDCESDKIITIDINDADANIINCKAAGFRAEAWSRKNSKLFLKDCKTTGNTGYGLWGKGLGRLIALGAISAIIKKGEPI